MSSPGTPTMELNPAILQLPLVDVYFNDILLPDLRGGWSEWLENPGSQVTQLADRSLYEESLASRNLWFATAMDRDLMQHQEYVVACGNVDPIKRRDSLVFGVEQCDRDARAGLMYVAGLDAADQSALTPGFVDLFTSLEPSETEKDRLAAKGIE